MKKFTILDTNGVHEYNLEVEETGQYSTEFRLFYSNGSTWSEHIKNTLAITVTDDGNGLNIKFECEVEETDMESDFIFDYSDVEKLNIMFRAIAALQPSTFQKFKMIPHADSIDL